jgi:hypothetical protein
MNEVWKAAPVQKRLRLAPVIARLDYGVPALVLVSSGLPSRFSQRNACIGAQRGDLVRGTPKAADQVP